MNNKFVISAVVVAILLIFFLSFNTLQTASINVESTWSQVENQMQRRADLIPNLVNTVKGYSVHEKEVIQSVSLARAKLASASTPVQKDEANSELNSSLSRLLAVVENYPNLKADTHFKQLMDELAGTENRIAVARKDYIKVVNDYNIKIKTFPGNLFASIFGFEPKEQFKIDDKAKQVPDVKF